MYYIQQALVPAHCSAHVVQKKQGLSVTAVLGMSLAHESLMYTHLHTQGHRAGRLQVCLPLLLGPLKGTHWDIWSHITAIAWSLLACPAGRITLGIRASAGIAATFLSPSP